MWTTSEKTFLKKLNSAEKIQRYLDELEYNPSDDAISPRYVMITGDGHCLEGGLLAACALELQGYPPLMLNLQAENDDHHAITVYRAKSGWGSISKSNTALLRGRDPVYKNVRELVMSYFEFYFNLEGKKALYAYSEPINLNRFNYLEWRTTDENLLEMGMSFNDFPHVTLLDKKLLRKLPPAGQRVKEACFLGADVDGLYQG